MRGAKSNYYGKESSAMGLIQNRVQSNLSTMATLWTEKSGHCTEEAVIGRSVCTMTTVFFLLFFLFEGATSFSKSAYLCTYKSKCINNTETYQKQRPTARGTDQVW